MAASSWCLKRQGEPTKDHDVISHIPLPTKKEVTVGRGLDVTVQLLSLVISRLHATFVELQDDVWVVKDHKSLNGIYVNGKRVKVYKQRVLKEGDVIQLGKGPDNETPAEFIFKLVKEEHTEQEVSAVFNREKLNKPPKESSGVKRTHSEANNHSCVTESRGGNDKPSSDSVGVKGASKAKRVKLGDSQEPGPSGEERKSTEGSPRKKLPQRPDLSVKQLEEMKEKLKQQERLAEERVQQANQQLEDMQLVLAANECAKEQLEERLKLREQEMYRALELQKGSLQAEKELLQRQMKEFMEKQLREKEEKMLLELKEQKESLMEEKRKVEESLQKELQSKLEEKDRTLQDHLEKEKDKLEEVICRKELEYSALESQLKESKIHQERQTVVIQKAKEEAIQNVAEVMEDELQCSLCYELFVQATTLNCSHSFCYWCVTEWAETKKHDSCPICRTKITSKNRSIVLDSYIDKMVENLSDELKKIRTELVAERKRLLEGRSGGKKRGRADPGNNAGGPGTSGVVSAGPAARTRSHVQPNVIVIEDDNDDDENDSSPIDISSTYDSDENSDNEDSSMDGIEAGFYAGYGACFYCGRTGHWANGCPFRYGRFAGGRW